MTSGAHSGLVVHTIGVGAPVLLLHGTGGEGQTSWARQQDLAARYQLRMVDRRGYGDSRSTKARRHRPDETCDHELSTPKQLYFVVLGDSVAHEYCTLK